MSRSTRKLIVVSLVVGVIPVAGTILCAPIFGDVAFERTVIDASGVAYERTVGDVDGDGRNDIVATSISPDNRLWLYRAPNFNRETLLTLSSSTHGWAHFRADDLQLADVDLDGDLDVVTRIGDTGDVNGSVVWIENPLAGCNNVGGTWVVHTVGSSEYTKDIVVADIDRDGRLDIVTRED
ncbi:MAG: VCBS repeat-containing protein, partial [Phycisphaerales bacterium]|nr:VCBS repeat-containing protein [Phycisphaerales bacterium]